MAETVYVLCAVTSMLCAWLLLRGYRRTSVRLLFWTGACFVGLAVNNVLLFLDLVIVPAMDLSLWRGLSAYAALSVLIFGLIWEHR
jgi:hypothetical protein